MHRQFRKVNLSPKYNSGLIADGHNFRACFQVGNRECKHEGHLTVKVIKSVLEEVITRPEAERLPEDTFYQQPAAQGSP